MSTTMMTDGAKTATGVAEKHGPTVARGGWVAKGAVYALVGVLTLQLALGDPSGAPDQQGALRTVADQNYTSLEPSVSALGSAASQRYRRHGPWIEARLPGPK